MQDLHSSARRALAHVLLAALLVPPLEGLAEIAGEEVLAGEASFAREGDVTTIHASDGAIIQYDALNVWANEELHFVQPDAQSRVLNQVQGDATHIEGGLYANGIVYILNPAGVFFGGEAIVDVGGLVAAAGTMEAGDFLAGRDRFDLSGSVANEGRIEATSVALLGRHVANRGHIHAPDGTIALVAGERVVMTRPGGHVHVEVEGVAGSEAGAAIEQTGLVDAGRGGVSFTTGDVYSLALNHEGITRGGEIELRAGEGLVRVAGELDASDATAGARGGEIRVTGARVSLEGARLDASGDAGGGSIRVGGDLRGGGALPAARRTFVDAGSLLRADALGEGDGGQVIVYASEATAFLGGISARGGAEGGDGGFAEISGAVFLWSDGEVDLRAVQGETGTLLYDPQDIEIAAGTADGSDSPDSLADRLGGDDDAAGRILFDDVGNLDMPFQIFTSEIEGTNADVVLEASNSISSADTALVTLQPDRSLSLRTQNGVGDDAGSALAPGIDVAGLSFTTSGDGAISLETGTADAGVDAPIAVGDLSTAGGAVSLVTAAGAITAGDIDTRGADGGTGGAGGAIQIAAAGAGNGISLGSLTSLGGQGLAGAGGAGGSVSASSEDGAIAVGAVSTGGGDGTTTGGAGGSVTLAGGDSDADRTSHVTVGGDISSAGGAGGSGAGGAGGTVSLGATGAPVDIGGTIDPLRGGGDLSFANVDASGGAGDSGGRGGSVAATTSDGAITGGHIDTRGGSGDQNGGNAGAITARTTDADRDDANDVALGRLLASGGVGTAGRGGAGGRVLVDVFGAAEIQDDEGVVVQEAGGGGDIALPEGIDVSGGAGGSFGGSAGTVFVVSSGVAADGGTHSVAIGDADTAAVLGRGGDGPDGGGAGSRGFGDPGVVIGAARGDVTLGAIDLTGGDASADEALGGSGGSLLVGAGFETELTDDPEGSLLLLGNIDVREGASGAAVADQARLAAVDSGLVDLQAGDSLEHGGQAGPLVRTTGDVSLSSRGDLGAVSPILVEGGGEERVVLGNFADRDTLTVSAGGRADVQVVNAGFLDGLQVIATSTAADIDVVQPGAGAGDRVSMEGSGGRVLVTEADGTGNQISIAVRYQNPDDDAPDATLVLATGSVTAGDAFVATSDGDLVVGDADGVVITAGEVKAPAPGDEDLPLGADVVLVADADGDGTGAVLDALDAEPDGAARGTIALRPLGDAREASRLVVSAAEAAAEAGNTGPEAGIGARGEPLVITGGGVVEEAVLTPLRETVDPDDPDPDDPSFELDPDATGGIFLLGEGAEELEVVTARVEAGRGDIEIEIESEAGDVRISGGLDTRPASADPEDPDANGPGGDIVLGVADGARIVLDASGLLVSGGRQTWNGRVDLARNVSVLAEGGLDANGTIDLDPDALAGGLFVAIGDDSRLAGDVGATNPIGLLQFLALEDTSPVLELDLASVNTTAFQSYGTAVELARSASFGATAGAIFFDSTLDAADGASAAADIDALLDIEFGGDVGALRALEGLDAATSAGRIRFDSETDQMVRTGAGGIVLDGRGSPDAVPRVATVSKTGGDLLLRSEGGNVRVADGDKLTGTRDLRIEAPTGTARFSDLNALRDITVDADVIEVFARERAAVRLASGALVSDLGTDLIANDVTFTGAFSLDGGGAAPRIGTPSGFASAPATLAVLALGDLPVLADVAPDGVGGDILDLAIPLSQPGFETRELDDERVEVPEELRPSRDTALASRTPAALLVRWLDCRAGEEREDCPDPRGLPAGSALRSERAELIALRYRALLSDAPEAREGRRALAEAAARPGAPLLVPGTRPVLTELARLLAEVRMLGLAPEAWAEVREAILARFAAAVDAPGLDTARLRPAVEQAGEGLPLS